MAEKKPELQRGLEARHIELIALGGTIGVGLFMGAASTLKWAGPSVLPPDCSSFSSCVRWGRCSFWNLLPAPLPCTPTGI